MFSPKYLKTASFRLTLNDLVLFFVCVVDTLFAVVSAHELSCVQLKSLTTVCKRNKETKRKKVNKKKG
jgi:hypothetical protein